jgi:hypothetical protein
MLLATSWLVGLLIWLDELFETGVVAHGILGWIEPMVRRAGPSFAVAESLRGLWRWHEPF